MRVVSRGGLVSYGAKYCPKGFYNCSVSFEIFGRLNSSVGEFIEIILAALLCSNYDSNLSLMVM